MVVATSTESDAGPLERVAPVADRLGRTLRDLRISVIDRCNFRCPYCMPEEHYPEHYEFFRPAEWLTLPEIQRLAGVFAGLGVSKIRITGGEPLLRKDLPALVAGLIGLAGIEDLALTTNGVLLQRHASALREAGLERVTVSLDSLDPEVFAAMSGGRAQLDRVIAGIGEAEAVGLAPIKINVVVQRGVNDHTIIDLLEHFRGRGHIVRFIEYMDVGNRNHWRKDQVVPSRELLQHIRA